MATTMHNVLDICRFCLCHNGLTPLPETTASLLTIQDIEHFTGIQITEEEQPSLALCDKCYNNLQNSVAFRKNCLNNDIIFKQLFSVVLESVKDGVEVNDVTEPILVEPSYPVREKHVSATTDEPIGNGSEDEMGGENSPFDDHRSSTSESEASIEMFDTQNNKKSIQCSEAKRKPRLKSTINKNNTSATLDGKKRRKQNPKELKRLCQMCGKLVKGIKHHINDYHTHERKYTCPHCPAIMSNRVNMKNHIKHVHEKKISKSCEICGIGYVHPSTFLRHMAAKHGIGKTYECKTCSMFFGRDAYSKHMRKWHKTPREFTCTICSKTYSSSQVFRRHQRVHSNDLPYACSQCPKRFKSSTGKKGHELTHTGIRFSCKFCTKSYSYQSLLNIHYRKMHAGEIMSEKTNSD